MLSTVGTSDACGMGLRREAPNASGKLDELGGSLVSVMSEKVRLFAPVGMVKSWYRRTSKSVTDSERTAWPFTTETESVGRAVQPVSPLEKLPLVKRPAWADALP